MYPLSNSTRAVDYNRVPDSNKAVWDNRSKPQRHRQLPQLRPRRNGTSAIVGPVNATSNDGCPSVRSADDGSEIGGTTVGSPSRNAAGRPPGDRPAIGTAYCGATRWAAVRRATTPSCYSSTSEGIRRPQGQYRTQ